MFFELLLKPGQLNFGDKKALYRDLYIIMDKLNMIFEVLKEEIQYYCIFY